MPTLPNSATDELQWWVELSPYETAGTPGVVTKHLSTHDTTTAAADTPANVVYDGDLEIAYSFNSHLFTNGRIAGRSDAGRGELQLMNVADQADGTGRFDTWTKSLRWGQRAVTISVSKAGDLRVNAALVRSCLSTSISKPNRDTVAVQLASALDLLNKNVSNRQFLGTGGIEGTADFVGKFMPLVWGRRRQVPGLLIDPTNNVWFFGLGPLQAYNSLMDGGAPITDDATDYATYANLIAGGNAPAAGHFRTCKALGVAKLGSKPSGAVTGDISGYAGGTQGYVSTCGRIAESAMSNLMGLVAGTHYTLAAFTTAADALQSGVCSAYIGTGGGNGLDFLDKVLGGAGFWYAEDRPGLITCGRLDLPTITGPTDGNCALVVGLEDVDDTNEDAVQLTAMSEPPSQILLRYQEFDVVQTTGFSSSITAAMQSAISQQWRTSVGAMAGSVATEFPGAVPLTIDSPFDDPTVAATEAARIATLEGAPRVIRDVRGFTDPFGVRLGQQAWLTYSRDNLINGAGVVIIGMTEDQDGALFQAWRAA